MAEAIFKNAISQINCENDFQVDSAGTHSYHVGSLPDERTLTVLKENHVPCRHFGKQVSISDFDTYNFMFAMDSDNFNFLKRMKPEDSQTEILLLRKLDPFRHGSLIVPDPYYGNLDDFYSVYNILESSINRLLEDYPSRRGELITQELLSFLE